jgi:diguanylate cyclase (GGDEF)-like protein
LLGGGLVLAFTIVVVGTFWAVHPGSGTVAATMAVAGFTLVVCAGMVCLPWHKLPPLALLMFPALLVVAEVALSTFTKEVASNYTSFFTLAFVYIGLTQPRRTSAAFVLLCVPAWILAQDKFTAALAIRLCLALVVWVLIGETLAARTARGRASTKRLIAQANSDVLTGLASRGSLSDRIAHLLSQPEGSGASLLLIDLDGFKTINDTFGHAAGDELLIGVANRLRASVRPEDLVARLGGDEFGLLLEHGDLCTAAEVAKRVLVTMGEPMTLSRGRVAVTASIGIVGTGGATTAEGVLRDADVAMYEAKSSGRNRMAIYEQEMQDRVASRLQLETELRDAVEGGQFEIHYQPIVNIRTGDIVGAEALLRWDHPVRGLLGPAEFLSASEEIGIIVPLGRRILRQACLQARSWQCRHPERALTIAVNLSAPEMFAADFATEVKEELARADLPGQTLVLEITERLLMADSSLVRKRLEELKELGVRVAIDDFGTGYSSLAYLREFPVDILKIDQSFIRPLGQNRQASGLLRSILAMAEALALDVIVEGVETSAQADILADMGCSIAQGYYFGRPMPADNLAARLAAAPAVVIGSSA